MSVFPFVSFVVITTALLAITLLGLMVHDELKFRSQYRAANDSVIPPAVRTQAVPIQVQRPSLPTLPKAA